MSLLIKNAIIGKQCAFKRALSSQPIKHKNATVVICGGFLFRDRHLRKYSPLYEQHNLNVMPILSGFKELTTPSVFTIKAKLLAEQLQQMNQPLAIHIISGSFGMAIDMLGYMDKNWRERNVKALVFDSAPPMDNINGIKGWLNLLADGKNSVLHKRKCLVQCISYLWYPYTFLVGLTDEVRHEHQSKIFGHTAVIPRSANILFLRAKNDPIINDTYINKLVSDLRDNQSPRATVLDIKFENSRHAMVIIDQAEEYTKALRNFIETSPLNDEYC